MHVEHQHSVAEANRFSQRGLGASGGVFKGSRAGWSSAPLWFSFFARLGECTSYTLRIEVFAVNWSSGLLTPGVIQGASIDPVESEFIDKLQDDGFSRGVIARYRQRDSPRCAFGLAQVQKVFSKMLLNALITGRFNCCATQRLSVRPASIPAMRPSRCRG